MEKTDEYIKSHDRNRYKRKLKYSIYEKRRIGRINDGFNALISTLPVEIFGRLSKVKLINYAVQYICSMIIEKWKLIEENRKLCDEINELIKININFSE